MELIVRAQGFRPVRIGGLYPLQGELSTLVEGSVIKGLSGLLAGFFLIVLIVSRSFLSALAMTFCLAITLLSLFGLVGLFKMPLDIISAPAANVALPMGTDEMIHQGYTVRRARAKGEDIWTAWKQALAELWGPILASMLIVTAGFAVISSLQFPSDAAIGRVSLHWRDHYRSGRSAGAARNCDFGPSLCRSRAAKVRRLADLSEAVAISGDTATLSAYVMPQHFMPRQGSRHGSTNALLMNRYDYDLVLDGQKRALQAGHHRQRRAQGAPEILNVLVAKRYARNRSSRNYAKT